MSGYISPPKRPKLLTKAELRATIAGLEERNMSTKGEPKQLSMRLARAMLKEIEYTELAKKDQEKVTAAEETLRRSPLPIFVG